MKCWDCKKEIEDGKIRCEKCFEAWKNGEITYNEKIQGSWTRKNNVATHNIINGKKMFPR